MSYTPSNQYHYLLWQSKPPQVKHHFDWKWLRRTSWTAIWERNDKPARFVSWWLFKLQFYHGTAKCNGTESYKNGAPESGYYDYTDEPSELKAFRWRTKGPDPVYWNNMGGS